jgi:membrane-bound lytic murein transglycosylase D
MKRTAGWVIGILILFLGAGFCGAQEAAMPLPAAVSLENNGKNVLVSAEAAKNGSANKADGEESAVQKPKWLEQAEKAYAEGVQAQEAGDIKLASRKFGQCLKIVGDKADQECLIKLKEEIGSFFSKAEEFYLALPGNQKNDAQSSELLEVSDQELENVEASAASVAGKEKNYTIPMVPDNPLVRKFIAVYTGKYRSSFQNALDKMGLYEDMIKEEIRKMNLPRELIYLPLVESEYKNTARSNAGAVGLWQFVAGTGRKYGLNVNYWVDERRDPVKSTRAALQHLKDLYDWFQDWHLALAAYNRGAQGVGMDLMNTRSTEFLTASERKGFPRETDNYVPKMMAFVLIADNAESYGFRTNTHLKPPAAEEVVLEKPLDLGIAAKCAGVSKREIEELNPAVSLWCTPKDQKDFVFKIPAGKKGTFLEALGRVKEWNPSPELIRYRVTRGDYLGRIASKFDTTVQDIMEQNKIRNTRNLRENQILVIRPGRKYRG